MNGPELMLNDVPADLGEGAVAGTTERPVPYLPHGCAATDWQSLAVTPAEVLNADPFSHPREPARPNRRARRPTSPVPTGSSRYDAERRCRRLPRGRCCGIRKDPARRALNGTGSCVSPGSPAPVPVRFRPRC